MDSVLDGVSTSRYSGRANRSRNDVGDCKMSALATRAHIAHFRRAYREDGMTIEEFDALPPTMRTLRSPAGPWQT
jgi:hypothetical protein